MPKIIENLKEKLLEEAKRQVAENGYAKTTIRSIAAACGVGIGTVYNYFASKDMLIASFMVEDWLDCLEKMSGLGAEDPKAFLEGMHDALKGFIDSHSALFYDKDAAVSYSASFMSHHAQLRDQIAEVIGPVCRAAGREDRFFADFVAESLLTWTSAGKDFEKQWSGLGSLFAART